MKTVAAYVTPEQANPMPDRRARLRLLAHSFQLFHEGCTFDPQQLRRTIAIAAGPVQRARDEVLLDARQVRRQVEPIVTEIHEWCGCRRGHALDFRRKIADLDLLAPGTQRNGTLNRVLELPDATRPAVRHEHTHRTLRWLHRRRRRELLQEMPGE